MEHCTESRGRRYSNSLIYNELYNDRSAKWSVGLMGSDCNVYWRQGLEAGVKFHLLYE